MSPRDGEDLETGYTTGACATAVTRAALLDLVRGERPSSVTIELPAGCSARFQVQRQDAGRRRVRYATVKDAGDDPDVTDGATIWAAVTLTGGNGVDFRAGRGVGTVTMTGLPVDAGEPAVNPVPREMMRAQVDTIAPDDRRNVTIEIGVREGEQLAQQTLNPRLGITDGLSILGTTGIVVPYSNASYIASIEQGIDVARANGVDGLVLTTGGRTESHAAKLHDLPAMAFVQFGTFLKDSLDYLNDHPVEELYLYMMPGKFSKLAQGHLRLHSDAVPTDMERVHRDIRERLAPEDSRWASIKKTRSVNQALSHLDHGEQKQLMQAWIGRATDFLREQYGDRPARRFFGVRVISLEGERLASDSVVGEDPRA